jgi:hypothetical protein
LFFYDYYFYLNTFTVFYENINFYNFNYFFLKNFKNFFNAIACFLGFNFKFLSFDVNERSFFCKNLIFSDVEVLKYNFFFKNFSKVLKNQSLLYNYKLFFQKNKIKFILVFDYEYFYNFFSYFTLLNTSIFALIPFNFYSSYTDFYLLFCKQYYIFYKIICYSYILVILNVVNFEKKKKNLRLFSKYYF